MESRAYHIFLLNLNWFFKFNYILFDMLSPWMCHSLRLNIGFFVLYTHIRTTALVKQSMTLQCGMACQLWNQWHITQNLSVFVCDYFAFACRTLVVYGCWVWDKLKWYTHLSWYEKVFVEKYWVRKIWKKQQLLRLTILNHFPFIKKNFISFKNAFNPWTKLSYWSKFQSIEFSVKTTKNCMQLLPAHW